jgi:hypothetical protein
MKSAGWWERKTVPARPCDLGAAVKKGKRPLILRRFLGRKILRSAVLEQAFFTAAGPAFSGNKARHDFKLRIAGD